MTYVRPDESARLSYDMIKSGQFEKAIQQGMAAGPGGRELPELGKIIPGEAAGFLGLRQVSVAGRQLQHHGRRRLHHDRLHLAEEQSLKFAAETQASHCVSRRKCPPRRARDTGLAVFITEIRLSSDR